MWLLQSWSWVSLWVKFSLFHVEADCAQQGALLFTSINLFSLFYSSKTQHGIFLPLSLASVCRASIWQPMELQEAATPHSINCKHLTSIVVTINCHYSLSQSLLYFQIWYVFPNWSKLWCFLFMLCCLNIMQWFDSLSDGDVMSLLRVSLQVWGL